MENEQNEVIQHIQETSELFSRLLEKHGDYLLAEYQPHEHVVKDLFAAMSIQDLVGALGLPNNIFGGYIRTELKKRRFRKRQLKARGRLFRQEGHACLV